MQLVIVESPAKAKTINKYLGNDYKVIASFGHIRDLPSKDGSVRPDEDFAVTYEISADSTRHVKAILDEVKKADTLILATDPDREGEAISWHILEALREKKALRKDIKIQRVVFNEITKKAVLSAISQPRDVDMDLVNAQQARRVLDYLVGFTLSPVLWRKLPGSKSAGRVQSVALRVICDREAEIEAFISQEYWDIFSECNKADGAKFQAKLTQLDGKKLDKFALPTEEKAAAAAARIKAASFTVKSVEKKEARRFPQAPFTTSTLQQEAARKLGFSAKRTMQLAQKLYEGQDIGGETVGLITYMRTDGVQVAAEAVDAARAHIAAKFGKDYLPATPRQYQTKAKNAQEAHEAVRPTDPGRTPDSIRSKLDADMLALYELIWKRLIASQMEPAILDQVAVDLTSADKNIILHATGSTVKKDGFTVLYREGRDDEEEDENDRRLPPLVEGEAISLSAIKPGQHFTEPPPRFSEASLVKRMEELGIGRPSTYASIISILQEREYVTLDKKRFIPAERGRLVTAFLISFFPKYVSYDFTAGLENELDHISAGEMDWKDVLRRFWNEFYPATGQVQKMDIGEVITALDTAMEPFLFPGNATIEEKRTCPSCANGKISLKLGKFGAFLGCSNYPECRYTRQLHTSLGDGEGSQTPEQTAFDAELSEPKLLGYDPVTGLAVTLRKGPYGVYVQLGEAAPKDSAPKEKKKKGEPKSETKKPAGPKRASLLQGMEPSSITLELALRLLTLPREVGIHPETGKMVKAGVGRFGPYLQYDGTYASLPKEESVLDIGINRAVDILAEKAAGRGGKKNAAAPLRVLGTHPDGGDVAIYDGKYGAYVKYKTINATIPKDADVNAYSLEEALELVAAKAGSGGKSKTSRTKKPAAKKPAARAKKS